MERIGKFTTVVVLFVASMLVYGFAIQKLWFWFIAPVFNVQALTIFQAYGLFLFVSIFRIRNNTKIDEEKFWKRLLEGFFSLVFDAAATVFLAWSIKTLFM